MVSKAAQICNVIISCVLLVILLTSLIFFNKRELKFERGFKLIFTLLTLGLIFKLSFGISQFFIDWSVNEKDAMKFLVWEMSSVSYV